MEHDALCFFDLEATGTDPYSDRIVEVYMARAVLPGWWEAEPHAVLHQVVDPGIPIPPEATAVHGITAADVEGAPTMAAIAEDVLSMVEGAVLVGFNSRTFDVPMLDAELRRWWNDGLPRDDRGRIDVPEVDLYRVWSAVEPRTLAGACRRWLGEDLEGAHRADADVEVLPGIMAAMLDHVASRDGDAGVDVLADMTAPEGEVDRAGKFRREERDGREVIVYTFGKFMGQVVDPSDRSHADYLRWVVGADFPPDTTAVARALLRGQEV